MVLAVQNEVKELLLVLNPPPSPFISAPSRSSALQRGKTAVTTFECVDLRKDGTVNYQSNSNQDLSKLTYSLPQTYIYEPNAAILKAGLFKEIAIDFKLNKLHSNTHLYTSEQLVAAFPGRIFKLKGVENFNKKAINPYLDHKKANITTRNFPYSVAQIKKKLGIKDGGNIYLFATTLQDEKLKILVCEK